MIQTPWKSYHIIAKRILRSTWNNLSRNKLLSIATILVTTLIIFFVNILASINYLANFSIDSINKKIDLSIELQDGIDIESQDVNLLQAELQQAGTTVVKISKEQALENFKQILPDLGTFLQTYRQNPLPESLYVTAKSIQDYEKVNTIVEKPAYKKIINFDQNETSFKNQKERIYKILDIANFAKRFVLILQLLFYIVAIIIILNTIQIMVYNRRDEIQIMKLVGASKSYITAPFIAEGVLYGITGVIIGLSLYVLFINISYFNIQQILPSQYLQSFVTNLWQYYTYQLPWIIAQQLLSFIAIGSLSSLIALSRFLHIFFMPSDLIPARKKNDTN